MLITSPMLTVAGVTPPTGNYNANTGSNTASTTFTFTSVSIGTASSTRYVVVAMIAQGASASPTSVTVGGISATSAAAAVTSSNRAELWIAAVPTGTTANIVVTFAASTTRCAVGSFSVYDITSTTPVNTATSSGSTSMTLSVNTNANSVVIGTAFSSGSAPDATWVGVTESYDTDSFSSGGGRTATAGIATGVVSATPRTVTCVITGSSSPVGVCASWS